MTLRARAGLDVVLWLAGALLARVVSHPRKGDRQRASIQFGAIRHGRRRAAGRFFLFRIGQRLLARRCNSELVDALGFVAIWFAPDTRSSVFSKNRNL
jgi:hypothetical protein